ncbi:molybdopterin-containing oxidoreductase family protein [Spirochaeta isovalerica]|uniref:Anaerobic dimethyl sulfoxide reductase subunit A n=1 Tax=Spirochaeta isovalerica TaxID=150 RepID=A0A841RBS5_9SPIO|nr:molybdopterin-dependent oxidoreductase [Spirochaeta isovalerica]MBB6481425.1 anaerobic dimethyl sulfoxide reductase subunit A [Spirochaeta isovalerica]
MEQESIVPLSCNKDCGAGCALAAHIKDGKVVKITDSPYKPHYMRGCLKGYRSAETLYHKDRLTTPLIRDGERGTGQFRKASWEEALSLISEKMISLRDRGRQDEILKLGGSGSCRGALHNTAYLTSRFLSLYGGFTDTLGDYSSQASEYVKTPVFGTNNVGIDAATLLLSQRIILWGFNPSDTRFDSEVEAVLSECSRKGTEIIVIDPRMTRTVKNFKARWIPILPGTDSAFMLAILWVLIERDLIDRTSLQKFSSGFDLFESYITGESDGIAKSPSWAEKICGIGKEEIIDFALGYSSIQPTALLPGFSLQRAIGGENADRLGAVLQLATGNAGLRGGSIGAAKWNRQPKPLCGRMKVPANPLKTGVPVNSWADAVLEGKAGGYPSDISLLYNVGGNFIGQSSGTDKTIKAFRKADFSVTHDYFLTDTARYCDVVLPVTTFMERDDIVGTQNNYLFYSAKAAEPVGQSKNDYEIFCELARRMGFESEFSEGKSEEQWLEEFLDHSEIDDREKFKTEGIYIGKDRERTALADFFSNPEKHPLNTESGRIEIASHALENAGGTLLPEHILIETNDRYPLRMITPHEKYRIHSQFDNIPSLKKLCDDKMWINSLDARERGIEDGDTVEVASPDGRIRTVVRVTDGICRGSLSLNQGVWALTANDGANANYLTSTVSTTPSMGTRTHSIIVDVKKVF